MTTWVLILGWTLVHFVWQGALLAALAAGGLTLFRKDTPQSRYMLASTTLALMLLSPLVTATWISSSQVLSSTATTNDPFTIAGANHDRAAIAPEPRAHSSPPPAVNVEPAARDRVFPVLVTAWLCGVLLLSVRLVGGWCQARRLQRVGLSRPPSAWQAVCDRLAIRLRLPHHVHVVDSSGIAVPSVVGWWRPVLLLPLTALAGLTPSQAEAIVAHELIHVRRHDYVVNVLQCVTETLLFYHPAVWWISHRMRIERERCCDAVVVRVCGDAADYATALLRLEEARGPENPTLAVAATGGALVDRVRRILIQHADDRRALAPGVVSLVTVLAFVVIVSGGYRPSLRMLEAHGQTRNGVIVTVNDEPVTQADLDHFRPLHGEPAATPLERVLVQLIDERLLVQRGQSLGFITEPAELRRALDGVKQINHISTDAALDAQLAKAQLTRTDLEEHLRRARVIFHVAYAEMPNGFAASDDEAKAYFAAHVDEFPLQTFDLAKSAVVTRLTIEHLGRGIVPQAFMQRLRAAATIVWKNAEFERSYANGLTKPPATTGVSSPGSYRVARMKLFVARGIHHLGVVMNRLISLAARQSAR